MMPRALEALAHQKTDVVVVFNEEEPQSRRHGEPSAGKRKVTPARLRAFSDSYFGPYAGYAQQYLFHYALARQHQSEPLIDRINRTRRLHSQLKKDVTVLADTVPTNRARRRRRRLGQPLQNLRQALQQHRLVRHHRADCQLRPPFRRPIEKRPRFDPQFLQHLGEINRCTVWLVTRQTHRFPQEIDDGLHLASDVLKPVQIFQRIFAEATGFFHLEEIEQAVQRHHLVRQVMTAHRMQGRENADRQGRVGRNHSIRSRVVHARHSKRIATATRDIRARPKRRSAVTRALRPGHDPRRSHARRRHVHPRSLHGDHGRARSDRRTIASAPSGASMDPR